MRLYIKHAPQTCRRLLYIHISKMCGREAALARRSPAATYPSPSFSFRTLLAHLAWKLRRPELGHHPWPADLARERETPASLLRRPQYVKRGRRGTFALSVIPKTVPSSPLSRLMAPCSIKQQPGGVTSRVTSQHCPLLLPPSSAGARCFLLHSWQHKKAINARVDEITRHHSAGRLAACKPTSARCMTRVGGYPPWRPV